MTAFQYDWNMLPIGQQLWLKHLMTYEKFPPLQAAGSYNLEQDPGAGQEGRNCSRAATRPASIDIDVRESRLRGRPRTGRPRRLSNDPHSPGDRG